MVGYNIYRGASAQGTLRQDELHSPSPAFLHRRLGRRKELTYFYKTTAVNKHGKESKFSNQVQVTIPNS